MTNPSTNRYLCLIVTMILIDGSHDCTYYQKISRSWCGMNVTPTTAVSCSVATPSSESLLLYMMVKSTICHKDFCFRNATMGRFP